MQQTLILYIFVVFTEISRLTKIKDVMPEYIEYNHIRVVIALLVQKYGQELKPTGELIVCSSSQETSSTKPKGELIVCSSTQDTSSTELSSQLHADSEWSSQVHGRYLYNVLCSVLAFDIYIL